MATPPIKRLRYFTGQYLEEKDFSDEQQYHLDAARRSARALYGAGVLDDGFRVKVQVDEAGREVRNGISIESGLALDAQGRQIVLLAQTDIDLPAGTAAAQDYLVTVRLNEQASDPQVVGANVSDNTRISEHVVIKFHDDERAIDHSLAIVIAKVTVGSDGLLVGRADRSVLQGAGLGANSVTASIDPGADDKPALSKIGLVNRGLGGVPVTWNLYTAAVGGGFGVTPNAFEIWNYEPPAKRFEIQPNGTTLLAPSGGRVGIGTSAPASLLHVAGDTLVGGTLVVGAPTSAGNPSLVFLGSNAPIGLANQQSLSFAFAGAGSARVRAYRGSSWGTTLEFLTNAINSGSDDPQPRLQISEQGYVGVGIAPTAQLHVGGVGGQSIDLLVNGRLKSDSNDGGLWISSNRFVGGFDIDKLGFQTYNAWRLTVQGNGNVGIGTTTPAARLSVVADNVAEIAGTAQSGAFRVTAGVLGPSAGTELSLASFGFMSSNSTSLGIRAHRAAAGSDWQTAAIGLGIDVDNITRVNDASLWLHSDGRIGIATPTPKAKLHVNGGARLEGDVAVGSTDPENADGWSRVLDVQGSSTAKLSVRTSTIDARFLAHDSGWWGSNPGMVLGTKTGHALTLGTNAQSRLTISAAGDVGIGTLTPLERLHVNGTTKLQGNTDVVGTLSVSGTVTGQGCFVVGMVIMWSGQLTQIPAGWRLCDGSNGTPDLRGKFIVGHSPNDASFQNYKGIGGAASRVLSVANIPQHSHTGTTSSSAPALTLPTGAGFGSTPSLAAVTSSSTSEFSFSHSHFFTTSSVGSGSPVETLPPYFVMAYLVYVG